MKKLILVLLFSPVLAFAQEDYKVIAQETCECIQKKDLSNASKNSIEMALGFCMLEVLQAHKIDVDMTDGEAMRKFGEKVGVHMAPLCPNVFAYLAEVKETEAAPATETVSGTIKSIEKKEFLFVTLTDQNNKEVRLVWLGYVEGGDEFLSDYKKLHGLRVKLTYQNSELFNAKAKGYFGYKEILAIQRQ